MGNINTGPKLPDSDPDRDYEIQVLVTLKGYGKKHHQVQTVQTMLKALHVTLHNRSIRAFLVETRHDPYQLFKKEEITRDDRNAEAPEKTSPTSQVDRPESEVDSLQKTGPSVGQDGLPKRSGDTGRHGALFPGLGRTEGEIAREQRMLNNESA